MKAMLTALALLVGASTWAANALQPTNPATQPYNASAVLACYRNAMTVCDIFALDLQRQDGSPLTAMECLGITGQDAARFWAEQHPEMVVIKGPLCAFGNDLVKLRNSLLNSMGKPA